MRRCTLLWCCLAMAFVCAGAAPALAQGGKADGTLVLGGKPVKLAYAYAAAEKGFFDPKKDDIVVLLTDVPLAASAVADNFERIALAKSGKLHCIELTLNAQKQPISVTLRHPALKTPESGGSTEDAFDAQTFDAKMVAGRFYRKSPGKTFDDVPYTYDVKFQAPVAPRKK